jgi:hypothetical protein
MIRHRHSRDYRFIRTSERKKKPETIIYLAGMSGAGGTHPVPIVACGVISVCRTHIVMAAGAFLFGYRVQPITCTLFHFVADARIGIFAAGALLFRIPDTAWPHAFLILSPKPVHMTACVCVFACMVVSAGAFLVWLTSTPPLPPDRTIFSFWLFDIIILLVARDIRYYAQVGRRLLTLVVVYGVISHHGSS